ncbi:uncharacterized protein BDW47DRAFT_132712 [Aspergillus candidus]|uniref:F-box domain-containing protein n=1 Tax=Aspergillus candidus TaxID=41067 RepID=A0A2I2F7A7_ASPCN|nr:hypothetical protein BDW47DRAFT_132712 [Aspergillus candidus]PLB36520.1 hypothetical protein BDW47DRAFT_132712 [Aspergillus candidus]
MASILSTPPEILHPVLASLSPSDLYAVCLTHRYLRSLAEPFLYSHIQWTWTNSQNPPITRFLRSIVQRPELASYVRVVILNGNTFEREWRDYQHESPRLPVTEFALDELVECIEKTQVPYAEQWIQELRVGTMDAFLALLLSQLPNLACLYLAKNFARESRLMGMMLRSALCDRFQDHHLPSFTRLKDVTAVYPGLGLEIREYTEMRNTADVLPLFYLPSVERIRTLVDNPSTAFIWPGECPPNPSRLVSLDLTMLREGPLGQVLSVTRGLQKLRWDWYYRPDLQDRFVTDIIDLNQIAADLSHIQETLTDLTITAGSDVSQADPEKPELTFRGSFTPFRGLDELKRLEVPMAFLLGFAPWEPNVVSLEEALSKNIEWLTITDDLCLQQEWEWSYESEYLSRVVGSWLQDWKEFTPRLRGFCLLGKVFRVRDWDPAMIQGFRDIGAQTGIQVEIIEDGRAKVAGQMVQF